MLADLRSYVLADPAVATIVSGRMFPVQLPQNVRYPCLSYSQVSAVRDYSLCGATLRVWPRITINSWAENYGDAVALADAVRRAINSFSGTMGSGPGTQIDSVKLDNEIDFDEPQAGLVGVYRRMQDYILSFVE